MKKTAIWLIGFVLLIYAIGYQLVRNYQSSYFTVKPGVKTSGLDPHIWEAVIAARKLWAKNGRQLVITSGTEGFHFTGSKHYEGKAIDLRTRYFDGRQQELIACELQTILGPNYNILLEYDHIHVSYLGKGHTSGATN